MSTHVQSTADGGQVFSQPDSLSSGLVTQPMPDADPPVLRVLWLRWHSGLRGSGLRVGDRIVAVNGDLVARPADPQELQRLLPRWVGQVNEPQVWQEQGLAENAPLRLTVRRRAEIGWQELEFTGVLRPAYTFQNSAGRRTIGPGGPDELANDGFGDAWSSWLEKWERWAESILDDDWSRPPWATDPARAELDAQRPRLDVLAQRYPGPFADAVAGDASSIATLLDGRPYELTAEDLAFRRLDDERAEQVAAAAGTAREAFLATVATELLAEVPDPELVLDEPDAWAGKVLALPPIRPRDWLSEAVHNWFAAQVGDTWCLVDTEADAAQRMQLAARRYLQRVKPHLAEDYAIVGRIKPEPRLIVVQGRAFVGLELEPIAATVGERMFVDLTWQRDGESPFAGEDEAVRASVPAPAADAAPQQVLEAFFAALKAADQDLWLSLFADWRAVGGGERPMFYPYRPPVAGSVWEVARRQVLETICDVRVVWRDEPRVVIRGDEYPGLSRVEEVALEVDHIRQVGGPAASTYRGFRARGLTRPWRLQRVHDPQAGPGPWRICTESGL